MPVEKEPIGHGGAAKRLYKVRCDTDKLGQTVPNFGGREVFRFFLDNGFRVILGCRLLSPQGLELCSIQHK